ncbi:hypothetical protein KR044_006644 [Drosophila immigrans]|nr:hypothetical protein KR044_006644 [Drosophila immigrans]
MPPVKKPKPYHIQKAATPAKPADQKIAVVSGQLKKRLPKAKKEEKQRPERGVVLVKHLPHGFFEQQLRAYFRQFGNVTRLRLARSERTGGSKGFAFVEFEYPEVAKVAADTMDNYLMFQKVVKATYIPPEKQSFNYFKNTVKRVRNKAGKDIYVSAVTQGTLQSVKKMNNWNDSTCQKRTVAGMRKLKDMQKKYKHLGIDFSTLLVEPQKKSKEEPTTSKAAKKSKKQSKQLELEDLLGNTINDDSEDEDYVDDDEDDADETLLSDGSAEEDEEDEEEEELPPKKSQKKKKNTAEERQNDLLKRKPGSGGVQKKKAAPSVGKVNKKAATQTLKLAAAKQLAKPLQKAGKKLKKK